MGTTQDKNRVRQIANPHKFTDLTNPNTPARLTETLENIVREINRDRQVDMLPVATGLTATSKPAAILLKWNAVPEAYHSSWDGARIWRVDSAVDSRVDFNQNDSKAVIVTLVRATSHLDSVGNVPNTYIYWVEWINLDGNSSGPSAGVSGVALWDDAAPGAIESLSVTGGNGIFQGSWKDPATHVLTLDNFAQQYSENSDFSSPIATWLIGKIYSHQSVAPNKAYYFRYAAHNQSGDTTSNTNSALTALLANGWGSWTNAPLNPVSSGQLPGTGTDTVIPGALVNLTVWGSNGDFLASWEDPATGNNSIDDIAEEYSISNSPWTRVEEKTLRWGNTRFLRGSRPNTTYHFRFAAHNKSGAASHATGPGAVGGPFYGETGWGPWTYWNGSGSTTTMASSVAVSSGQVTFATAASGARMTMQSSEGIKGYDASDNVLTQIGTDGKATFKSAINGARFEFSAANGLRGYNSDGVEVLRIDPAVNWGKIEATGLRMHPNVSGGITIGGRTNAESDINLVTADGSELGNACRITLVHGAGGYINLWTQNTARVTISSDRIKLNGTVCAELGNMASEPAAPAAGGILYCWAGALKYVSAGGTRTEIAPN